MAQRSILVAVDIENQTSAAGKRRLQAVCHAASFLAQRLKSGIDLLYIEDMSAYHHDKWDPARIRSWQFEHEAKLKLLSRQFELPVSHAVRKGSPADQILKESRSSELIVMGTHGRKGLRRLLVGSVTEEVVRHSKRPVMVIGPVARERELTGQRDLKILVATDLGKNSRAAERYALSLAGRIGARVLLIYCLSDSINAIMATTAFSGSAVYRLDKITAETRHDAADILEQKCTFFRTHGVRCDYKIQAIHSQCGVYRESEDGYSFIVMGTRGRNVVLGSFFGSTARQTILSASIPVIIVHSGK